MNRFDFIGNLTKDVELTKVGELSLAKFTLAVNRSYKNKDNVRETDFFQLQAWRELGENIAKYTKKGERLRVEGRVKTSSYEKDGEKRYTIEFEVTEFELLGSKKDKEEAGEQKK